MRSALNNDALRRVSAVAFRRVRRFVMVKYRFGEAKSQRIYLRFPDTTPGLATVKSLIRGRI